MEQLWTFENLEAWKAARKFKEKCRQISCNFPPQEKFRLVDQLIRSSRSVTANIAEGYGRFHYKENMQFCRQGRGSLFESLNHLLEAFDCGYLSQNDFEEVKNDFQNTLKILNGYIAYLEKQKSK